MLSMLPDQMHFLLHKESCGWIIETEGNLVQCWIKKATGALGQIANLWAFRH